MNIIRGVKHLPARMVIYGPPGVGKSTFACSAPEALALDYEGGLDTIGPARVKGAATWDETLKLTREACQSPGEWKTVVVDTIDRLEDQASFAVCQEGKKRSLADFGYGDGFEALTTKWREFLHLLESAREKQREVILVGHVQAKALNDPTLGTYDRYIATLSKRCWAVTHRWADAVLFANYESGLVEGRAIMTGARVLHPSAGTGYEAKNRWGLTQSMLLSWDVFAKARAAVQRSADEVRASIRSLATAETKDAAESYISDAGDDVGKLVNVETALRKKVGK